MRFIEADRLLRHWRAVDGVNPEDNRRMFVAITRQRRNRRTALARALERAAEPIRWLRWEARIDLETGLPAVTRRSRRRRQRPGPPASGISRR